MAHDTDEGAAPSTPPATWCRVRDMAERRRRMPGAGQGPCWRTRRHGARQLQDRRQGNRGPGPRDGGLLWLVRGRRAPGRKKPVHAKAVRGGCAAALPLASALAAASAFLILRRTSLAARAASGMPGQSLSQARRRSSGLKSASPAEALCSDAGRPRDAAFSRWRQSRGSQEDGWRPAACGRSFSRLACVKGRLPVACRRRSSL